MNTTFRIVSLVMVINAIFAAIIAVDLAILGEYLRATLCGGVCLASLMIAYFAHDTSREVWRLP